MTREEREQFVREAIDVVRQRWTARSAEDVVRVIVDKWEEDVDAAFQRGIYAEQERYGAQA